VFVSASEAGGLAATGKQVSFVSSNNSSQQLIPHGSYSQFGPAASSNSEEEMSAYTYDTTSSNSASSSISSSFEASFVTAAGVAPVAASQQQQQPLTPELLAAAAAAAGALRPTVSVPDYSLSTDSGVSGGEEGATLADAVAGSAAAADAADKACAADQQQQQQQSLLVSPSPFSARKPPAYSLLSPISSTSTRPLRGAASSSAASFSAYSSMEVSELLTGGTSEDCGTVNMISSEEGLAIAAEAALLYEQLYEQEPSAAPAAAAVDEQQLLEAGVLQDPLAFEQLMAAEPAVLAAQQQQQIVQQQQPESVFEAAAEAAAAAAAGSSYGSFRDSSADAILSAAAEICALGEDVDASALLPKEDTLPPMALARFAAPAGAEEEAADQQAAQLELLDDITAAAVDDVDAGALTEHVYDDDVLTLQDQAVVPATCLPGSNSSSSSSSFVSASSSSSSLTKDQLPCLGLTVTVPSPADKAAVEAARLSAANADAAAAVAAAKPAYQRGQDDLVEPSMAQEGLRLVASAHIIPHVDKVRPAKLLC
jgi:hypothetical protein